MATSFATLGGVADPRLGDEADAIGKGHQGGDAADIHDSTVVVDHRRGSVIYMDTSITFED
jgi:hypothetical protein